MGVRHSWRGGSDCKSDVVGLSRFESYHSHINFASIVQRLVYDPSKVEMSVRFRLLAQVAARLDVSFSLPAPHAESCEFDSRWDYKYLSSLIYLI